MTAHPIVQGCGTVTSMAEEGFSSLQGAQSIFHLSFCSEQGRLVAPGGSGPRRRQAVKAVWLEGM